MSGLREDLQSSRIRLTSLPLFSLIVGADIVAWYRETGWLWISCNLGRARRLSEDVAGKCDELEKEKSPADL